MKLDILFHYEINETTGEITYIGKEELKVDTASRKTSPKPKIDNGEPSIVLETNKLVLTQSAVDLLQVCDDCRIDIKYDHKERKTIPVIGTDAAFGTKSGNKLTKSNTVSYRGANNTKLATYGTVFKLEPTNTTGVFYMIGDKVQEETPKELVDINSELDLDSLDTINIEDETSIDLDKEEFNL